jgi:predicted Zn-dependent protease
MTGSSSTTASGEAQSTTYEELFNQALGRYQQGFPASELVPEFESLTQMAPRNSAAWTCLAWLQLLNDQPIVALRSAKQAVRLNPQDPQARINLSVAMLETGAKGVREHIDLVKRVKALAPELASELDDAITDGLNRRPGWTALQKVKDWLEG